MREHYSIGPPVQAAVHVAPEYMQWFMIDVPRTLNGQILRDQSITDNNPCGSGTLNLYRLSGPIETGVSSVLSQILMMVFGTSRARLICGVQNASSVKRNSEAPTYKQNKSGVGKCEPASCAPNSANVISVK